MKFEIENNKVIGGKYNDWEIFHMSEIVDVILPTDKKARYVKMIDEEDNIVFISEMRFIHFQYLFKDYYYEPSNIDWKEMIPLTEKEFIIELMNVG